MPNVKTVILTGGVIAVTFEDSNPYYMIFNMGDSEVYASGNPDIVPYADGVYTVPAGVEIRISPQRSGDTVYLFGSGTVQVRAETIAVQTSFKRVAKGGDPSDGTADLMPQFAYPNNYLIYDDMNKPSVMVAVSKFYLDEVIDGASHTVHPAFIVNGVEQDVIYISKYQNIVENGRAYSLPMQNPAVNVNFDQAWNYCKNKGAGWHLMTNAEWAAIALWCRKNGTMPNGNNDYGKDISETTQRAVPAAYGSDGKINAVLTGSGNADWYHDNTFAGISDLNGNVWEWCGGMRLNNGEIQVIADNNAADRNNSVSSDSGAWKAIMSDGTLAAPGTTGTLKYKGQTVAADTAASGDFAFETLNAEGGVTIPELMKALALAPDGTGYKDDHVWLNAGGEKIMLRGGPWFNMAQCGVFALNLNHSRSDADAYYGFRSAYYDTLRR